MLQRLQEGHLGMKKTQMKALDVLFWPGMVTEITESEPLKFHEIPPLPWAKGATRLLPKNGWSYLVSTDYYSTWLELTLLNSMISTAFIAALMNALRVVY